MRCYPLALASVLLIAADAKDDAVKEAKAKLKGAWDMVSIEHPGGKVPIPEGGKFQMVIENDKFTMQFIKGETKDNTEATYTIDPTQKPPQIDIVFSEGPIKGMKGLGIYVLDKDDLKIFLAEPGEPRPKEIAAKEGVKAVLMTIKRQKK
jgi:uncharacterized protein (TIGR03067 family)